VSNKCSRIIHGRPASTRKYRRSRFPTRLIIRWSAHGECSLVPCEWNCGFRGNQADRTRTRYRIRSRRDVRRERERERGFNLGGSSDFAMNAVSRIGCGSSASFNGFPLLARSKSARRRARRVRFLRNRLGDFAFRKRSASSGSSSSPKRIFRAHLCTGLYNLQKSFLFLAVITMPRDIIEARGDRRLRALPTLWERYFLFVSGCVRHVSLTRFLTISWLRELFKVSSLTLCCEREYFSFTAEC